jgi:hypothetical protein
MFKLPQLGKEPNNIQIFVPQGSTLLMKTINTTVFGLTPTKHEDLTTNRDFD